MANNASPANTEINPKYLTYPFIEYKSTKNIWLLHKKTVLLHRISKYEVYETVFILTPVLSDEQMKEAVAKFKKLLTDNGAEILNEEIWGLKKLAYNIQKKSSGFYAMLEFNADPSVVRTLETGFRRDEKVIRFITIKQDKYSAAYAEKRRAKWAAVKEA